MTKGKPRFRKDRIAQAKRIAFWLLVLLAIGGLVAFFYWPWPAPQSKVSREVASSAEEVAYNDAGAPDNAASDTDPSTPS